MPLLCLRLLRASSLTRRLSAKTVSTMLFVILADVQYGANENATEDTAIVLYGLFW